MGGYHSAFYHFLQFTEQHDTTLSVMKVKSFYIHRSAASQEV